MKPIKLLGIIGVVCLVAQLASATLILEYKFNETGTSAPSTGTDPTAVTMRNASATATDLHGVAGSGLTGDATDRAFDNTASTGMGFPFSGGYANQADNNAIDGLESFTLQGWYKTSTLPDEGARLFDKGTAFYLLGNASGGAPLTLDFTTGSGNYYVNSVAGSYSALNQWVFFAVSYDGTTGAVKFYQGSPTSAVVLVANGVSSIVGVPGATLDNASGLAVGNYTNPSIAQRPFDGLLDNMRIYGSPSDSSGALSLTALEAIRFNDVIPEPSTVWLMLVGGLVSWRWLRRR